MQKHPCQEAVRQYTVRELAQMIRETDDLNQEMRDRIADQLELAKAELCRPEMCIAYFDGMACDECRWR